MMSLGLTYVSFICHCKTWTFLWVKNLINLYIYKIRAEFMYQTLHSLGYSTAIAHKSSSKLFTRRINRQSVFYQYYLMYNFGRLYFPPVWLRKISNHANSAWNYFIRYGNLLYRPSLWQMKCYVHWIWVKYGKNRLYMSGQFNVNAYKTPSRSW